MMYNFVFWSESCDVTLSDIGKKETEKPVAIWHPAPPAPPLLILLYKLSTIVSNLFCANSSLTLFLIRKQKPNQYHLRLYYIEMPTNHPIHNQEPILRNISYNKYIHKFSP